MREGRAQEEVLATMARTADAMRSLAHVAALTGLPEIAQNIAKAEETLRRGGVVHPFAGAELLAERAASGAAFWRLDGGDGGSDPQGATGRVGGAAR